MASRLPKVHIPVTVNTEGVEKGLSKTEESIRRSLAKLKRMGVTVPAGVGAAGKGPGLAPMAPKATAFLGGVGKLSLIHISEPTRPY